MTCSKLLIGIGVAVLAIPLVFAPAMADPNEFDAIIHAEARDGNRNNATPTPQPPHNVEEFVHQDVVAGRYSAEAGERLIDRSRALEAEQRRVVERELPYLRDTTRRIQDRGGNIALERLSDPLSNPNDPNSTRNIGEGAVELVQTGIQGDREAGYSLRPIVEGHVRAVNELTKERARLIAESGTNSPEFVHQTQEEARKFDAGARRLPRVLDEHEASIRDAERRLDERRTQIAGEIEKGVEEARRKYGNDPKNWPQAPPPPPRRPGEFSYIPPPPGSMPPPAPSAPRQSEPPPWAIQPITPSILPPSRPLPSGSPTQTSHGIVRRGTIPPSDPYEGLRVSQSAGGTGATTPATQGASSSQSSPSQTISSSPQPAPQAPRGNAAAAASAATATPRSSTDLPPIDPTKVARTRLPEDRVPLGPPKPPQQKPDLGLGVGKAKTVDNAGGSLPKGSAAGAASASALQIARIGTEPVPRRRLPYMPGGQLGDEDATLELLMNSAGKKSKPSPDLDRMVRGLPPIKPGTASAPRANPLGERLSGFFGAFSAQLEALLRPLGNATDTASGTASGAASVAAQRVPTTVAQQRPAAPFVQPRQPGGPDYPQAPRRSSHRQQNGAAQGQWRSGDSFGGAAAAAAAVDAAASQLPDVVDIARQGIEDRFNAARQRWDEVAAQVEYDENGVPHRIHASPPPENTYRRPPPTVRPVDDSVWGEFERGTGSLSILDLEPIYAGWDMDSAPIGSAGARTPSSAGTSLSSAGNSLRLDWNLPAAGYLSTELAAVQAIGALNGISTGMGVPTNWGGLDLGSDPFRVNGSPGPVSGSLGEVYGQTTFGGGFNPSNPFGDLSPWNYRPLAESAHDLAQQLYGPLWSDRPFRVQFDPSGLYGHESGGGLVASLGQADYLTQLNSNGLGGLNQLLAQPFNIVLTWGSGAYDIDLHLTGPTSIGQTDRFHIYYDARGSQTVFPFAELIRDCICSSGSEVVLTSQLAQGGVYRVSAFNFGNQSATSTNLSNDAEARIQVVRGGQAVAQGNGTTIVGGTVIYTGVPPTGRQGNTWVAVEIDPKNGRVTAPSQIIQSQGSDNVH